MDTWDVYMQVYLPCHGPNDPRIDEYIGYAEAWGFELAHDKGVVKDVMGRTSYAIGFRYHTDILITGRTIQGGDYDEICWEPDYPDEDPND